MPENPLLLFEDDEDFEDGRDDLFDDELRDEEIRGAELRGAELREDVLFGLELREEE